MSKPRAFKSVANLAEAWDAAEKIFVERGREWSITRHGGRFWIDSEDVRVTCVEDPGGSVKFMLHVTVEEGFLAYQMTVPEALVELLIMLDDAAQNDGTTEP